AKVEAKHCVLQDHASNDQLEAFGVADVDVGPVDEGLCDGFVDGLVGLVTLIVLKGVLEGGDEEDSDEGHGGQDGVEISGKDWEDLEDDEEEKVEVGNAAELLKQVFWQESDDGVLCGLDFVCGPFHCGLAVLVQFGRGKAHVDVDVTALLLDGQG